MPAIVLTTINARYIHANLGLRWLYANLGELQPLACIQEYTLTDQITDMAEQILATQPQVVGIAVYIWNAAQVRQLVGVPGFARARPPTAVLAAVLAALPMRLPTQARAGSPAAGV